MNKWEVVVNGSKHEIVYEGRKVSGKAKISIDGNLKEYTTVFVDDVGTLCPFDIESSEFILKLMDDHPLDLIQDSIYISNGAPLEKEAIEGFRAAIQPQKPLPAMNKKYMGSFLTFIVLTFINIGLITIKSTLSFPFSATVPQLLFLYGWYPTKIGRIIPSPLLMIGGLLCIVVYLILFLLSKKKVWPILVTIILVLLDTGVLIYLSIDNLAHSILDIAFHAWVLWTIVQLYRTRRSINKESNLVKTTQLQ